MRFFELSIPGVIMRFYLMMAIVLVAGFTGVWALSILALPVLISCMTGASFGKAKSLLSPSQSQTAEASIVEISSEKRQAA